ncbi:hypothetical protein MKX03_001581, partial [Papaver bracteatum]
IGSGILKHVVEVQVHTIAANLLKSDLVGVWVCCSGSSVQGYFKCAYECFDMRRKFQEISNCVENYSILL